MENAAFRAAGGGDDGGSHWGIDIEFDVGLAVVEGDGGAAKEGEVAFAEFVEHPLGFVPTGGEVLVVADLDGAFALFEDLDDLLVEPQAGGDPAVAVGVVDAVFAAEGEGFADGVADGDLLRRADCASRSLDGPKRLPLISTPFVWYDRKSA